MHSVLYRYVRDENRHPVGVVCATLHDGEILLGWSEVNEKMGDKFDRKLGKKIALGRALNGTVSTPSKEGTYIEMDDLENRARKYFKCPV